MIKLDYFSYSDADWDNIKRTAEKGLGRKCRDNVWIGGRWRPTLLTRLEIAASVRIALTGRASAQRNRARIRQLEALQHNAIRFEEKMVTALSTDFSVYGEVRRELQPGVELDFLDVTRSFIARLRGNIGSALRQLRYRTKSNASKLDRDLFWWEALDIWCELGGEPTSGDTADFLIAVSRPVFDAMRTNGRRKKKGPMPDNRASVMDWLRRTEKARQAEVQEKENGDVVGNDDARNRPFSVSDFAVQARRTENSSQLV